MGNWIDSTIAIFAPKWAADRSAHRRRYEQHESARRIMASYQGAIGGRLDTPWGVTSYGSANLPLKWMTQTRLRDRARELERNNPIVAGMLSCATDNIVGSGFQLKVTSADETWNNQAEQLFAKWFDSAEVTGLTWLELQQQLINSFFRDGDVGVGLLQDGRLQGIEGDLITSPLGQYKANVIDGVEINDAGRATGYWIASYDDNAKRTDQRVDATDLILFAHTKRLGRGQLRGEPFLAQCFGLIDQISQWIEAEVVAARMSACYGLVSKRKNPAQYTKGLTTTGDNGTGQQQREIVFAPGMNPVIEPDEDIVPIAPEHPGTNFPEALQMLVRIAGLTLALPIEQVLLDYTSYNFASSRASLLQTHRRFKAIQSKFISRVLRRIYRWRVSKFIKDGLLPPRDDAFNHKWIAEPWPFLDPMKEAQALQMQIDSGSQTLTWALAANGHELKDYVTTRANELEQLRKYNIPVVHHQVMQPFVNAPGVPVNAPLPVDESVTEDDEQNNGDEGDQ